MTLECLCFLEAMRRKRHKFVRIRNPAENGNLTDLPSSLSGQDMCKGINVSEI